MTHQLKHPPHKLEKPVEEKPLRLPLYIDNGIHQDTIADNKPQPIDTVVDFTIKPKGEIKWLLK